MVSMPRITIFTRLKPSLSHEIGNSFCLRGYLTRCVYLVAKLRFGENFIDRLDPLRCGPEACRDSGQYYPDTKNEKKDLFCFLVRREHPRPRISNMTEPIESDTL